MKNYKNRGFIKIIIILVIILIVLGYLGLNVKSILNSPTVSSNLNYVWNAVVWLWKTILVVPITFIWNKVMVGFFWNNFAGLIDKVQAVEPSQTLPKL
ncbi:MAG: hypothetical protein EXS46_02535 [Candidatus Taylorbacteria bacterium]|nr:hypothetical protein [Candidatus Taylorbacteria bacterium]